MIHYMIGTEDNLKTTTKAGCGKLAEDIGRKDSFVFWKSRHLVDCASCLAKIAKVEALNERN